MKEQQKDEDLSKTVCVLLSAEESKSLIWNQMLHDAFDLCQTQGFLFLWTEE